MKRFLFISVSSVALLSATPSLADPITIAVAAASTASAVAAAGGIAATTFFGLAGFAAVAAQFAVRAALGYAMNALTAPKGAATSRGYIGVNQIGSSLPHQIIYGETRVGGVVFYQALTSSGSGGQDRLHKMIAFAGHEIESYEAIYLDDKEVTLDGSGNVTAPSEFAGQVRILEHLGMEDQTADATAVSELSGWTTDHRARGIAYLYVRFEDAAEFPTGAPVVTALIRGRKVEDTRQGVVKTVGTDTAVSGVLKGGFFAGPNPGGVGEINSSAPTGEDHSDFNGTVSGLRVFDSTAYEPTNETSEPVSGPDRTYDSGDLVTSGDFVTDDDFFFAIDVDIPASPSGCVFEVGGADTGLYLGFTSGDLVFRAGDGATGTPSECAAVRVSATPYEGKSGTFFGSVDPMNGVVTLYWRTVPSSTPEWSDNPAMCLRDYLLADYGLANDSSDINDDLCEAAAYTCDEDVAGSSRYTCNGAFTLDGAPEDIIRNLLSSMGGIFWNYQGQWAMQAAEYITPTITLTEDDLRSELEIATKHSRRDNFNTIKGQFKGSETNYQPDDYPEITSGLFLAEDAGVRATSDLPLLFSDSVNMAQRIARTALRRNRKQITVTGAFGLRALGLRIGDNVMVTVSHMGWSQKVFEVVDWRLGMRDNDIQINMILREMSEEVFTGIVSVLEDESGNTLLDESGNELEGIAA